MVKPLERAMTPTPPRAGARLGGAALRRVWSVLGPAALGVLIALLIGGVMIILAGTNPLTAYQLMWEGAFGGRRQWTETILKATPLLMIGLGLTVAFRARVWNIGAEGQYFIGALFGGFVALQLADSPAMVVIPAILVAGLVGGALWALIPALLHTRRGMNIIISTLMLNYIAILIVGFMVRVPLREPDGFLPQSAQFSRAAQVPNLFGRIHVGVLIALALVPLVYLLIWRTPIGFRLRAIGSRASVARFSGISVERGIIFALLFSGALAGLAGIVEVSYLHTRLKGPISGQYGFTAILVALLGRLHPVGVVFAAIFFAALTVGAQSMHTFTGLPANLANVIQALVVLFVLGVDAYFRLRRS